MQTYLWSPWSLCDERERSMLSAGSSEWPQDESRRVAYLVMQDGAARGRIAAVLGRAGWTVVPQPTEFHLIQAIAGVIDGRHPELSPSLSEIRASAGT